MTDTVGTPRRHGMGWQRDQPDPRDFVFFVNPTLPAVLPSRADLRPQCNFPVFDQGQLGSCTANVIASAMMFHRNKMRQLPSFIPSRLFIYFNSRVALNTANFDSGAQLRVALKTAAKLGACHEALWPYDATSPEDENSPFTHDMKAGQVPPPQAYLEAQNFQITRFQRVGRDLASLRGCLAEGFPFAFGITLFKSFWDAADQPLTTAAIPDLKLDDEDGRHAALAVGYDDDRQVFIVRNSWGAAVQDEGHFFLPYAYMLNPDLCADYWTIRSVES